MKKILIPFLIILIISTFSRAEIYKCVDKEGNVEFTTKSGPGCVLLPGSVGHNNPATNQKSVQAYRVVNVKDLSMKAISKRLSSYTTAELRSLPRNIRKQYQIVVPPKITRNELKAAMKHLVKIETAKHPDIDAIVIFAYDRIEDAGGMYTFGKMEWCPNGNWGGVTPHIASTNDRSSYKYVFHINDKVGNISPGDRPTKEEFAIYDKYRKALWDNPDIEEEVIKKKFARKLGLAENKLDKIIIKVLVYRFK